MRRWFVIGGAAAGLIGLAVAFGPRNEPAPLIAAEEPVPEFHPVDVTSAAQEGLTLSGVVKDPSGNPVPKATVSLSATTQASLSTLECGDCKRLLLSCSARESGVKVASLLAAKRGELAAALT